MKYKTKILVDYPDAKGIEAAVPEVLEEHQITIWVNRLLHTEKEMTAFRVECEAVK